MLVLAQVTDDAAIWYNGVIRLNDHHQEEVGHFHIGTSYENVNYVLYSKSETVIIIIIIMERRDVVAARA